MPAINEITSYLVGLGFKVDKASFEGFTKTIDEATKGTRESVSGVADAVNKLHGQSSSVFGGISAALRNAQTDFANTGTSAESFGSRMFEAVKGSTEAILKFQLGATAAFEGVGGALVGTALHFADADQKARLFGQRLFIGTQAARSLQISLGALDASFEDVTWDRELHGRFVELQELQKRIGIAMGGDADYEKATRSIRDIRFEFQKFGVELTYLGQGTLLNIFRALGTGPEDVLAKLRSFNDWLVANLPRLSQQFAKYLAPVIKEIVQVGRELVPLFQSVALVFTNLIGILSGDTSLEGTAFSFDKVAKSVGKVIGFFASLLHDIVQAEQALSHFALAIELVFEGKFTDAIAEVKKGFADLTAGSMGVLGAVGGGGVGAGIGGAVGSAFGGPIGAVAGAGIGSGIGTLAGAIGGAVMGHLNRGATGEKASGFSDPLQVANANDPSVSDVMAAISARAQNYGIAPEFALAVAKIESGFRQYDSKSSDGIHTSTTGAKGLFQLEPSTAQDLGVDPKDINQNIVGGLTYLAQLFNKYKGDATKTLEAYNMGEGKLDRMLANHQSIPTSVQQYAANVQREAQHFALTVNVNVAHSNAKPEEIARATSTAVRDQLSNQTLGALVTQQGVY